MSKVNTPYNGNNMVVSMYEDLQLTPEEIAADQELDVTAVKMVLASSSMKYRNKMKEQAKLEDEIDQLPIHLKPTGVPQVYGNLFTKEDLELAAQTMVQLTQYSENDGVKQKAAQFIINEVKGRNDKTPIGKINLNISILNETFEKMRLAKEAARNKMIDLSESDVKMLAEAAVE